MPKLALLENLCFTDDLDELGTCEWTNERFLQLAISYLKRRGPCELNLECVSLEFNTKLQIAIAMVKNSLSVLLHYLIGYESRLLITTSIIPECLHDYISGNSNGVGAKSFLTPPDSSRDSSPDSFRWPLDKTITSFSSPNPEIMHTRRCSLFYIFALLCVSNFTVALTTWESIHQTIHTYPLAIDSKDFALLSEVSTLHALAYKPLK